MKLIANLLKYYIFNNKDNQNKLNEEELKKY